MRGSSSAAKRPPWRCSTECRTSRGALARWWYRGHRVPARRRCLRAGVLPRIRKGGLAAAPGAASWPQLVLTPTGAPLDELALRVGLLAGADAAAVRRSLDADPDGFTLTVRQAALAVADEPVADTE